MNVIDGRIHLKIIFFGSALAGKTTAIQWIFDHLLSPEMKLTPKVSSIKTSFGQTLLFDFMPIQLHENVIVRVFALTGQDYYLSTRKILFENVDGVFFVVDSQRQELIHNMQFVKEFRKYQDRLPDLRKASIMVLYNKRDLADVLPVAHLAEALGLEDYPSWPTCALTGENLKPALLTMIVNLLTRFSA